MEEWCDIDDAHSHASVSGRRSGHGSRSLSDNHTRRSSSKERKNDHPKDKKEVKGKKAEKKKATKEEKKAQEEAEKAEKKALKKLQMLKAQKDAEKAVLKDNKAATALPAKKSSNEKSKTPEKRAKSQERSGSRNRTQSETRVPSRTSSVARSGSNSKERVPHSYNYPRTTSGRVVNPYASSDMLGNYPEQEELYGEWSGSGSSSQSPSPSPSGSVSPRPSELGHSLSTVRSTGAMSSARITTLNELAIYRRSTALSIAVILLALLSSSLSQLRLQLAYPHTHSYTNFVYGMIGTCIALEILSAGIYVFLSRYDFSERTIENIYTGLIFCLFTVAVVSLFIVSFTADDSICKMLQKGRAKMAKGHQSPSGSIVNNATAQTLPLPPPTPLMNESLYEEYNFN